MTPREQFNAVMQFDTSVPALKTEYGYWITAIKRFIKEGMPVDEQLPPEAPDSVTVSGGVRVGDFDPSIVDQNVRSYFSLDPYPSKFPMDVSPMLKEIVIEETEDYKILKDKYGITKKVLLTGASTPLDMEFPVTCRDDFEHYKTYYNRPVSDRLPPNWQDEQDKIRNRDFPLRLGGFPYGFLGYPRHLIGTTELFMLMYDDPQLVHDMNAFFLDFIMEYWDVLIRTLQPDIVLIWEDMAGKTGSMISKEMFDEFLRPYYIRIIDFLHQYGIENIHVDSDGNIEELIPLWVDLGVTGIFPFERQASNDMPRIREQFPKLQIMGAVDKRIFMVDKDESDIDEDLKIIKVLLRQGGCIPHADHHVPDDSCWHNFSLYRNKLNELIDKVTR